MKKYVIISGLLLLRIFVYSCTNIIVTKGASEDGSVFLAYTNDAEYIYQLKLHQAMNYKSGESIHYYSSRNGVEGTIPQVPHTNALIGFHMNEHQVSIGETTFKGREEDWNHSKFLEYWDLMVLALERASTAREAITVMTNIAEKYGYGSEGESFSIADKNEAWILEMAGTGTGKEGAVWVAIKIPDGMVSCHANSARIGEFPLNDSENCIYSRNVITNAIAKGYYNPKSGKPFSFHEAYCPTTPGTLRYCSTRVWSILRRVAPSLNLSSDYHRGIIGTESYPLWVKPDKKISLKDVFSLVRDHYEETEFDMTKGYDAGPYENPNRWRPLYWKANDTECSWERPISTFNTSFSFIAQSRSWLPNEVGGLIWFGEDDTYFTCFIPIYNSVTKIPLPFQIGDIKKFSWQSAWWIFNFVSNYSNLRFSEMAVDVKHIQDSMENKYVKMQSQIEEQALALMKKDKNQGIEFLTNYTCKETDILMEEWKKLGEFLITKYNDGYIKNKEGKPIEAGYPVNYFEDVFKYRKSVKLPVIDKKHDEKNPDSY